MTTSNPHPPTPMPDPHPPGYRPLIDDHIEDYDGLHKQARQSLNELNEMLLADADTEDVPIYTTTRLFLTMDLDELYFQRDLIQADEHDGVTTEQAIRIIELLHDIVSDEYLRDDLSHLAMSFSLCPMHFIDWAICFDDDDPECHQIRLVFPYSHDT